ncbi:MAG TPA: hypothetical protein VMW25_05710 [Clostridia bacterium]|nr:hypothetical protein [Clostridia bacterium]
MPEEEIETTIIQVKKGTAQALKQAPSAEFGDSYEDIIQKLLKLDKKTGR